MHRTLIRSCASLVLALGIAGSLVSPLYAQTAAGDSAPPPGLGDIGTPWVPPADASADGQAPVQAAAPAKRSYEGLTSCFDYYRFGSTPVTLSAGLSSAVAGAPLGFTASIRNDNPYPVTDASLYVKVMRYGHAPGEKNVNGPDVVDFFPVGDSLSIRPGAQADVSGIWNVPADAEAGEYMMAAYIVSSDRFNLAGLTFTDDVIGGAYNFSVVNDAEGAVRFDKATATVLGRPFYFAAFPPRVPLGTADVPVGIDVVNTTGRTAAQEITWTLYRWDGLRAEQVIDRKTESVVLAPGERAHLSYVASDTEHSVYYVLGSLTTEGGASSIVGIRFVRGDVNEPRLNFVGASAYPAGEGASAFACVHSTGTAPADGGRLELVATRSSFCVLGSVIAKNTFEGSFSGEIMALTAPFTKAADSFSVTAKLFQGGALVDEVTVSYSCEDLGADSCPHPLVSTVPLIAGIAALIVIIAAAAFIIIRRRAAAAARPVPPPSA